MVSYLSSTCPQFVEVSDVDEEAPVVWEPEPFVDRSIEVSHCLFNDHPWLTPNTHAMLTVHMFDKLPVSQPTHLPR